MVLSSRRSQDPTEQRIKAFEGRFDNKEERDLGMALAAHGAFPLTLTTDVVYCLRETFLPQLPWYWAADLLLSNLCNPVGYDLYEMEVATRRYLLRYLRNQFGDGRINRLEDFMVAYLRHRLQVEGSERPLSLGEKPEWTTLACLRPGDAYGEIQQRLRELAVAGGMDQRERFRLAALVESYGDLLADQGFRPLMVEMADQVAEGEPIDEVAALAQQLQKMGFGVGMVDFEVVTVVLGEAEPEPEREELVMTEVETVTVDERGRVIQRQRHEVFYFEEPLIELSSRNPVSLRNRVSKPFAEVMPLRLMAIPSGKFWMGSPESEEGRWSDGREGPRHQVSVEPFFISQFPITQAQWRFVAWERRGEGEIELELEPSYFKGDDLPVEQVSWYEAVEFCQRLSELTGRYYRLPTEAEWEYACRGDTTTPFYFGATVTRDLANYTASITYAQAPEGEYREKTTPVGQFLPNTFGLYDMHGNVREWCLDRWHGNYESGPMDGSAWLTEHEGANRVVRSGSWNCIPRYCRSACRNDLSPGLRSYDFGFRVVCDLQGL